MPAKAEAPLEKHIDLYAVHVQARDIRPYLWAYPCFVPTGNGSKLKLILNPIVARRWTEDGLKIQFMLESHNFITHEPEMLIRVVAATTMASSTSRSFEEMLAEQERFDSERQLRLKKAREQLTKSQALISQMEDALESKP